MEFKIGDKVEYKPEYRKFNLEGIGIVKSGGDNLIVDFPDWKALKCTPNYLQLIKEDSSKFKVGDKVKIKEGITPKAGWGSMKDHTDEIGTIISTDDRKYNNFPIAINFPRQNPWVSNDQDIELVQEPKFKVGDKVKTIEGGIGNVVEYHPESNDYAVSFPFNPTKFVYLESELSLALKEKKARRTQPIEIETEKLFYEDSNCRKVLNVNALKFEDLPEEYLKSWHSRRKFNFRLGRTSSQIKHSLRQFGPF